MSLWAANDAKGTLMALTLQYGSGGGKEFLVVSSKFLVRGEDWGKSDFSLRRPTLSQSESGRKNRPAPFEMTMVGVSVLEELAGQAPPLQRRRSQIISPPRLGARRLL
jgi:hypothetical protein